MAGKIEVSYHVSENADALSHKAAEYLVERVEEAVAARGRARIAVSGGSTPKRTFALLADAQYPYRERMPWQKLEFYFVDERCVPPDHKDSNYRMTRETLLEHVPLPPEQVYRMEGELDPEAGAARYESAIRNSMRLEGAELPTFDVISLGIGDDGHTASLFPHTEALHELGRIVVPNYAPSKDMWRITLTWPVINQARNVFFLIQGADKAAILKKVLLGAYDPETLPSQLIRPRSGKLEFLLDKGSAAELAAPGADGWGRLEIAR
jgi:6-phosphogluconolactonase